MGPPVTAAWLEEKAAFYPRNNTDWRLKRAASFPIAAGQSKDPFFLAAVFGILVPILLQVYFNKILKGIVLKRSAMEIAKEVLKPGYTFYYVTR